MKGDSALTPLEVAEMLNIIGYDLTDIWKIVGET